MSRWGGGTPAVTERDVAVLSWIGEQYGVRADVVPVLLGQWELHAGTLITTGTVSRWAGRNAVTRWQRAGLVTTRRLLGRTWVVPTRAGLTVAGLPYPAWEPKATTLGHVHAVGLVRLAVEPTIPAGGRWLGERALRRDLDAIRGPRAPGQRRELGHLADAAIEAPEELSSWEAGAGAVPPPRVAIEVELTRKEHWRLPRIVGELRRSQYVRAVWFAPADVAGPLRALLAGAAGEAGKMGLEVRPLPEVAGLSYEVAR